MAAARSRFLKIVFDLREETEWIELVECGANHIVDANYQRIMEKIEALGQVLALIVCSTVKVTPREK